jgi:hypothetical protein
MSAAVRFGCLFPQPESPPQAPLRLYNRVAVTATTPLRRCGVMESPFFVETKKGLTKPLLCGDQAKTGPLTPLRLGRTARMRIY